MFNAIVRNSVRAAKLILAVCCLFLFACSEKGEVKPDSDVIKVMFIGQITDTANATPLPEAEAGIRASVQSINARGGIHGKSLHLIVCDDKADANEAAKCARKAVSEKAVATLGNVSNFGNVILPILAQAGVASIGHNPISAADFSSPTAFPLQAGSPGMLAGAAKLLADQGVKRIRIATVDSPAGAVGETFAKVGLADTDARIVGMSLVPIGAPDYALYATTAVQDADGVLVSMNADQGARFISALRQVDATIPVAVTMTSLTPATIAQLNGAAEGIGLSLPFMPTSAPSESMALFLFDMQQYAPEASVNSFSLQAWLSAQALERVLNAVQADAIDASLVLNQFSQLQAFDVGDVIPPLTTTIAKKEPFNRLFVDSILYGRVSDGDISLADGQWHRVSF